MALGGINVGQVASDALWGGLGALGLEAVTDYFNLPFLSGPSVVGQGMNNAELLLNATGGLAVAGAIFSMISKKQLLGSNTKNLLGTGIGILFGTQLYPTLGAGLVNQVPTI